jgi:branched-chain amino acid transport system permease protein
MNRRQLLNISGVVLLVVFFCLVPVFLKSIYWIHVLVLAGINVLMAASLRFIMRTGQLSLGHAGFMLLGAYGSALLVMKAGLTFWVAAPLGALLAAVAALAIGYPFLRLKGIYFAILTLLLAEVLRSVGFYWHSLTGGFAGLLGIPAPNPIVIPGITTITFDTKTAYYYLMLVVVLLSLLILYRLEHSRLGFTCGAIKEADILAQSVGINIMWYKILVFAIGCFFAGIAGALFAHFQSNLVCEATGKFGITTSISAMIYMVVGGEARFAGPIVGAIILTLVPELARGLREFQPLIFGGLLVFVVFFMPEGIVGLPERFSLWYRKILGSLKKAGSAKVETR